MELTQDSNPPEDSPLGKLFAAGVRMTAVANPRKNTLGIRATHRSIPWVPHRRR